MKDYFQHFILMAGLSFLAALLLCAWDSFRWRNFRPWGVDEEDGHTSGETPLEKATPRWQIALGILIGVPLSVVILPVMVGAIPAMLVALYVVRARWNWRIIYRALRRRGAVMPTFESLFVAPFVTFWRWRSRRTRSDASRS
jgi:hypothetical protein